MALLNVDQGFIAESVYCVFAKELLLDRKKIDQNLTYNSIPEWDSVAHIHIILSLEEAFAVSFDETEIGDLTSVEKVIMTIEQRVLQPTSIGTDPRR